jgi:hypothetical protein
MNLEVSVVLTEVSRNFLSFHDIILKQAMVAFFSASSTCLNTVLYISFDTSCRILAGRPMCTLSPYHNQKLVSSADSKAIAKSLRRFSRRLPTAAARVPAQVRSCGICGQQSCTGADFLLVLRFPQPILIPPTSPHLSSIGRGWYNRPVGRRHTKWTQSHSTPRNL